MNVATLYLYSEDLAWNESAQEIRDVVYIQEWVENDYCCIWIFIYTFVCEMKTYEPVSPRLLPFLPFFRPSRFSELCAQEKTSPSWVRNKECCSPQLMSVMTQGRVQDTGLRLFCGLNCPMELSPQQYSRTMSASLALTWWMDDASAEAL